MFTTQESGKQTGQISRIVNTRAHLTAEALRTRVRAGTNPSSPVRNLLRGADESPGLFGRLAAWLRGER
jgi:hypothetical protein